MSRNQERLGRSMEPKYVKRRQRGIAVIVASIIVIPVSYTHLTLPTKA